MPLILLVSLLLELYSVFKHFELPRDSLCVCPDAHESALLFRSFHVIRYSVRFDRQIANREYNAEPRSSRSGSNPDPPLC